MKNTMFAALTLLCGLTLAPAVPARAADAPKATTAAAPAMDPAQAAMMAEMMKYAQPGPEHATLASLVGTWKATVKSWMGPGEPAVSQGTMVNTMQFGGRCLEGRYTGEFMGAPFDGVSLMGFDNQKKEWWSFWTDSMSTSSMMQTGVSSTDGKSIVCHGTMAGMDGKPMECTSTTKLVDADTHVYTMSGKMGDQSMTMMEITYQRAK